MRKGWRLNPLLVQQRAMAEYMRQAHLAIKEQRMRDMMGAPTVFVLAHAEAQERVHASDIH